MPKGNQKYGTVVQWELYNGNFWLIERGRLPPPKIFGVTICGVQFSAGNIQRRICTFGTESVTTKVNNEY